MPLPIAAAALKAGFRSNTAPRLIDVADYFVDLGEIAELVRKDSSHPERYEMPAFIPPDEGIIPNIQTEIRLETTTTYGNSTFMKNDIETLPDLVRVSDDI